MKFLIFYLTFEFIFSKKLLFVLTHFRHGARAPLSLNKNNYDSFNQLWSNPGELTVVGQRMHYILGLHNHEKYIKEKKFLSENYNPNEIYILSTNYNRTIQSALAQIQGLYYLNSSFNDILNDNQKNISNPPININQDIQKEIDKLNSVNSALPQFLQTIPINIINNIEHEIIINDNSDCLDKIIENENIIFESEMYVNIKQIFNDKYSKKFNKLLHEIGNYSIPYIIDLCDEYISDIYDGRDLNFLNNFDINLTDLEDYCLEISKIYSLITLINEKDNNLLYAMMTPFFRELLYYMKKKIDMDINNITDDTNPKFVMFSGHDDSLGAMEIFLIKVFDIKDDNFFINPIFSSSCFFEVYKKDNITDKNNFDYSDYIIEYIFNDKLMKVWEFEEFYNIIHSHLWSKEQIFNYCEYNKEIIIEDPGKQLKYIILILILIIFTLFGFNLHFCFKYLINDDSKLNKIVEDD